MEPEPCDEQITDTAVDNEATLGSSDVDRSVAGSPDCWVPVDDGAGITEVVTGPGAAVTAASVVMKAKIEGRVEVRKAEIAAETHRLKITEKTKREQLRLKAGQPTSEATESG
ncbi:hypothetical protein [Streptomyces murinus]|uniref:hypothetical protein n=1 Tax=Streptomyces murinus TaxID=33900 RepID=UPI003F48E214